MAVLKQAVSTDLVSTSIGKIDSSERWHVLLATFLGEMFDGLDASIFILVIFPALSELLVTKSHSVVGVHASIIIATFMIGWAIGGAAFGALADQIGRARTLTYTILLYAIFTGLCALSHTWQEMAFYRFFVGCGIGGEVSIGGVLVAECWRGNSRFHATGVLCSSFGFGYLFAALLNLAIGGFGWRWLFVVGVMPALLTAYIRARLKEPAQFELARQYKLRLRAKPKSELSAEEASWLRFTFPELFSRKFIAKTFLVTCIASASIIGYWAVMAWIPPWINQLTGTAAVNERSMAAISLNIGSIISCFFAGALVLKFGRRVSFLIGFLGSFISCTGMFLTTKAFGNQLLVWTFLVGFFGILLFPLMFIYVPELFETKLRATAFGFSIQFGRIMAAIAALAGGQLIGLFGGSYAMAGATISLCYVVGLIVSIFIKPPVEDLLHDTSTGAPLLTAVES